MESYFYHKGNKFKYIKLEKIGNSMLPFAKPSIIYINGFGDCYQNHIDLLEKLNASGREVYSINLPGIGGSEEVEFDWDYLESLILVFLDEIDAKKVLMIGHSFGAGLILRIATRSHSKVAKISVYAPLCYPLDKEKFLNLVEHLGILLFDVAEDKRRYLPDKKMPISRVRHAYLLSHYLKIFPKYSLDVDNIKIPFKIIVNERDEVIDNSKVIEVFRGVKNMRLDVMPDLGHSTYYRNEYSIELLVDKLLSI